jgi:hypothetical protein
MRQLILTILCLAFALPALAQDVDLGLGGDVSSLLNIAAPRGNTPAARGATPAARGANAPVDRLVRLREMLAGANMPLTKDEEVSLNAVLNNEIPEMRRTLQARIAEIQKAKGGTPPALPGMEELTPEIIRLNDQLLGKMANAPGLAPEQQAFLKKLYKDQVKSRGGFDAIKLTLEDAGAAFSPEQISQIQPLFDGQTDKQQTLAKVLKLLTPAQRAALLAK